MARISYCLFCIKNMYIYRIKYYNNFIMDMVLKQQPIIFIQKNHNQYNQNGQIFQNNQNPISQQKCHNNNKSDKYY